MARHLAQSFSAKFVVYLVPLCLTKAPSSRRLLAVPFIAKVRCGDPLEMVRKCGPFYIVGKCWYLKTTKI